MSTPVTMPRHRHSPRVRRLALENGVDADAIVGTGPGGRVIPADVYRARQQADRSEARDAQHTQVVEVDVTRVLALGGSIAKTVGQQCRGVPPVMLFAAKAVLESLQAHPALNTTIAGDGRTVRHARQDLGVAFDLPDGLLVPVLRDAGALSLAGLQRRLANLAERTHSGQVEPSELTGGSFTLYDNGDSGILLDTPNLHGAQVAALSVGSPAERPVVVHSEGAGSAIAVRSVAYLALTHDQRMIRRAEAAEFLVSVKAKLEAGQFR